MQIGNPRKRVSIPDWGPNNFQYIATAPAMWPTHPLIQWIPQTLSPGIKQPVNDFDHTLQVGQTPQSSAR